MLKVVLEKGLSNILVVVTRYFGGILLGTGGLVKAYTEATEKALESVELVNKTPGYLAEIQVEYSDLEALKYYLKNNNTKIVDIEYAENISVIIEITKELSETIKASYNVGKFKIIKYEEKSEKFVDI